MASHSASRSLRGSLTRLVLVVSLPLMLLVGYGIYNDFRQQVAATKESLAILARMMVTNTERKIWHGRKVLDNLQRRHSGPVDSEHCMSGLAELHQVLPGYTNIGVTNLQGEIVCSALGLPKGKLLNVSNSDWFRALSANKDFTVGPPFIGVISKKWVLMLATPLRDARDQVIGGINLSLDLNSYDPDLPARMLPPGSNYGFLAQDGTLVWQEREDGLSIGRPGGNAASQRIVQLGDGAFETTGLNGVDSVFSLMQMPEPGWIAFVSVPTQAIYSAIWQRAATAAALALIAFLLIHRLAVHLARRIAAPIVALEQAARRVHEGELNVSVEVDGPREVAAVAKEFNFMVEARRHQAAQLEHYRLHLEELVAQRTAALQESTSQLQGTLFELRGTQKRLLQTEKLAALGSIVVAVSHELNTPLGNCITVASALDAGTDALQAAIDKNGGLRRSELVDHLGDTRSAMAMLLRGLTRVSSLLENFKEAAVNQTASVRSRFALRRSAERVAALMHCTLAASGHTLQIDIPQDIVLDSYAESLEAVFIHMMNNALLHAFEKRMGGQIHIAAYPRGKDVLLTFSDNGAGMTEEAQERVFEPFFTTQLGKGGSGLGMHICYNLVTGRLGGDIDVSSKKGQGTTYTMVLPRVVAAPAGQSAEGAELPVTAEA